MPALWKETLERRHPFWVLLGIPLLLSHRSWPPSRGRSRSEPIALAATALGDEGWEPRVSLVIHTLEWGDSGAPE
ncbi:MAG: hypothetical protein Kow0063_17020 [Anaerolineae bacterium]